VSRWRFLGVWITAVTAILAVGAGPAAAAPPWERMPCFAGAVESTKWYADGYLELTGRVDCAGTGSAAAYGVAHYGAAGGLDPDGVFDSTLREYGAQAPSRFLIGNEVDIGARDFGLCVVTDYDVRVACVRVTRVGGTAAPAVTPLSPNDPLVNRRTTGVYNDSGGRATPGCGGCW
jgi:hypothetical protein